MQTISCNLGWQWWWNKDAIPTGDRLAIQSCTILEALYWTTWPIRRLFLSPRSQSIWPWLQRNTIVSSIFFFYILTEKTTSKMAEIGERAYLSHIAPCLKHPMITIKWSLNANLVGRIRILFIVTLRNFRVSCIGHFRRFKHILKIA
jgi:hypothetical protein